MIMTNDDEEQFLIDNLCAARREAMLHKEQMSMMRLKANQLDAVIEEYEQALVDYMKGNGIKQTTRDNLVVTLGTSESVDCPDISAVPTKYIRTKETHEINKALIRAERPANANWYSIKESDKITITSKGF